MNTDVGVSREDFRLAAAGFVEVLEAVPADQWGQPALGVWSVRDLAGHTSRALLTGESYLEPATTAIDAALPDPVAYYRAAAAALADPDAVAERGRQAGAELGADPATAVSAIVARVLPLVAAAADLALVRTPVGSMTLLGYLPTRTFELAVHSLDLLAATSQTPPAALHRPVGASLRLAAELAAADDRAMEVLLALTGRRTLTAGFSVL